MLTIVLMAFLGVSFTYGGELAVSSRGFLIESQGPLQKDTVLKIMPIALQKYPWEWELVNGEKHRYQLKPPKGVGEQLDIKAIWEFSYRIQQLPTLSTAIRSLLPRRAKR